MPSNSDNIDNQEAVKLEATSARLVRADGWYSDNGGLTWHNPAPNAAPSMCSPYSRTVTIDPDTRTTPAKLDAPDNQEARSFTVGTWQGRPAVFVAPTSREKPGGGTVVSVGWPLATITDAAQEPETAAQMIVDALNRPDNQEALAGEGVDKRALQYAALQAFNDRDDREVSDEELAASILRAAGVKLSDDATAWREAHQGARTLPSNEALAGDDRNGVEGLVERLRETDRFVMDPISLKPRPRNPDGPAAADLIERLSRTPSSPQADVADVERVAFQGRVQPWMLACFGEMIAGDREERNHRFLEEALELVQACGCTAHEAHQLVDYVYGRPLGEPSQEVGGVMVTLAALCLANGLDMHAAGETELTRIWTKVEQIRVKQAAKPKHSPLPATMTTRPAGGEEVERVVDRAVAAVETVSIPDGHGSGITRLFVRIDRMADAIRAALTPQQATYSGVDLDPPMKRI